MSPGYCKPDPWALKNRRTIRWTAGTVLAAVFFASWQFSSVWNRYLLFVAGADLLLWMWLTGKSTPDGGDWWDYLLTRASEDPAFLEKLKQIDQEFRTLWNLDQSTSIREMLKEDLEC